MGGPGVHCHGSNLSLVVSAQIQGCTFYLPLVPVNLRSPHPAAYFHDTWDILSHVRILVCIRRDHQLVRIRMECTSGMFMGTWEFPRQTKHSTSACILSSFSACA